MASAAAITPFFDQLVEPDVPKGPRGDRSSSEERANAVREILSGSDPRAVAEYLQRSPRTVRAWLNAHEQEEQVRKLEGRVAQLRSALREERPRFSEIIDSYIQNNIRPRAGSDSIYVTTNALAPYCLRRAVLDVKYRLFGAERTLEESRGMMIGNVIESYFAQVLASQGYYLPIVGVQKHLTDNADPHRLSGRIDFLDADGLPVEIKAPHPFSWPEYQRLHDAGLSLKDSNSPWPVSYYNQLQQYLWLGEWERGVIVAVARDELKVLEFEVERDDERIGELKQTAQAIREHCAAITEATREHGRVTDPRVMALLPDCPGPDAALEPPCGTCRFSHMCQRQRQFAPVDYQATNDRLLADALEVVDRHADAGRSWKEADEAVRDRVKLYMSNYPDEKEVTLVTQGGGRLTIRRHGKGFRYHFDAPPRPLTAQDTTNPFEGLGA